VHDPIPDADHLPQVGQSVAQRCIFVGRTPPGLWMIPNWRSTADRTNRLTS
jgi:hypothetical protein